MKQTWTDTHFGLRAENQPTISTYKDRVTFSVPGYTLDGHGFAVDMGRAHLTAARKLVAALEALPPLPSESDDNPFDDQEVQPCEACGGHLSWEEAHACLVRAAQAVVKANR